MDCPICESTNIDIGRTMHCDGCIIQKMICNDCGSRWNEYYELSFDFYEITEDTREEIEQIKESEVE